jgi:hypothetical protein
MSLFFFCGQCINRIRETERKREEKPGEDACPIRQ